SASASFALAAGNTNPQGIADPPTPTGDLFPAPSPDRLTTLPATPLFNESEGVVTETPVVGGRVTSPTTIFQDALTLVDAALVPASPSLTLQSRPQAVPAIARVFAADPDSGDALATASTSSSLPATAPTRLALDHVFSEDSDAWMDVLSTGEALSYGRL